MDDITGFPVDVRGIVLGRFVFTELPWLLNGCGILWKVFERIGGIGLRMVTASGTDPVISSRN